ncbi:MAG: hypothetical protein FD135_239 [Comamonadaceae bacterium]|nr:MAG: hypothetical protein FD135_239 [Comamonadaceae bacterium]
MGRAARLHGSFSYLRMPSRFDHKPYGDEMTNWTMPLTVAERLVTVSHEVDHLTESCN